MLALLVLAVGFTPQAQQQHNIAVRAEEQQRQIVRERREQVDREHGTELLLQRRAEAAAAKLASPDEASAPGPEESAPAVVQPPAQIVRTRPDFSFPLMARAAAAGLLAGLSVLLLGRFVERRFSPAR